MTVYAIFLPLVSFNCLTQWGRSSKELAHMCDYSLHTAKSRPARVGD